MCILFTYMGVYERIHIVYGIQTASRVSRRRRWPTSGSLLSRCGTYVYTVHIYIY